jgi:hypothetical protein
MLAIPAPRQIEEGCAPAAFVKLANRRTLFRYCMSGDYRGVNRCQKTKDHDGDEALSVAASCRKCDTPKRSSRRVDLESHASKVGPTFPTIATIRQLFVRPDILIRAGAEKLNTTVCHIADNQPGIYIRSTHIHPVSQKKAAGSLLTYTPDVVGALACSA